MIIEAIVNPKKIHFQESAIGKLSTDNGFSKTNGPNQIRLSIKTGQLKQKIKIKISMRIDNRNSYNFISRNTYCIDRHAIEILHSIFQMDHFIVEENMRETKKVFDDIQTRFKRIQYLL